MMQRIRILFTLRALCASLVLSTIVKAQTNFYTDAGSGDNVYDGLSATITNGHGPKLNISAAINSAASNDFVRVASGFYQETNWNAGAKSLTLLPQGTVVIYDSDPWETDSIGDGISDGWRQHYFGGSTTTNLSSCASCNPDGDGLTNLEEYQNGSPPWNSDNDPPVITYSPVPNSNGWFNSDVTIYFYGTDTVSGAVSVTPSDVTVTGETNGVVIVVTANDSAGNTATKSIPVNIDKTPPTILLDPGNGSQFDNSYPLLLIDYADTNGLAHSGLNLDSLTVTLNSAEVTANFYRFANRAILSTNLSSGTYTWSATISDYAGNSVTSTVSFFATGTTNTVAPILSNVNIVAGMILPDVSEIWVQGKVSGEASVVSASVNGGDSISMNRRAGSDDFGYLLPLEPGTNLVALVASDGSTNQSSQLFSIIRTTAFRAAITSPVFGSFAEGQMTSVCGYVSAKIDEGLPSETNLVGLTINGVSAILDWGNVDEKGNVPFCTDVTLPTEPGPIAITGEITWEDDRTTVPPPSYQDDYEVLHHEFRWEKIPPGESSYATYWNDGECVEVSRSAWSEVSDLSTNGGLVSVTYNSEGSTGYPCNGNVDAVYWEVTSTYTNIEEAGAIGRWMEFGTNSYSNVYKYGEWPDRIWIVGDCCCIGGPLTNFTLPDVTDATTCHGFVRKECEWLEWQDCAQVLGFSNVWYNVRELALQRGMGQMQFRAPLHYPTNQVVLFTFTDMWYARTNYAEAADLSQVKFIWNGVTNNPAAISNDIGSVSYVIAVGGGVVYSIAATNFVWPSYQTVTPGERNDWCGEWPSECGWEWREETNEVHYLAFGGFHNGRIRFKEKERDAGFDNSRKEDKEEPWLVVPLSENGEQRSNECLVTFETVVPEQLEKTLYFIIKSVDSLIAQVDPQQTKYFVLSNSPIPLNVIGGTTADKTEVGVYLEPTGTSEPLAKLHVRVLPRKTVRVGFTKPTHDSWLGQSNRTEARVAPLLNALNTVWNKQANIYFTTNWLTAEPRWRELGIANDYGAVVSWADGDEDGIINALRKQRRTFSDPATLHIVFVKNVESDPGEEGNKEGGQSILSHTLFAWWVFLDDATSDDTQAVAHEAGHHIGKGSDGSENENFVDDGPADSALPDNVMNWIIPGARRHHLTVHQARIANEYLP